MDQDVIDNNVKVHLIKQVEEMKKDIKNQTEEELPIPVRNLFTKLFTIFNSVSKTHDDYNMLFYYIYYVIYVLYMGPDCLSQGIVALQECVIGSSMEYVGDDKLNIFDDKGNRLTIDQLENN